MVLRGLRAAIFALCAAVLAGASGCARDKSAPPPKADEIAPATAPARVIIADSHEPGNRLVVSGNIVGPDGKPIPGVSVYAYHTDVNGHYDPNEPAGHQGSPRLKGFLRTGPTGRYIFSTIRPAPYPNGKIPAHVHFIVSMTGYRSIYLEMMFSDDPRITDEYRAAAKDEKRPYRFSICAVKQDPAGTWLCKQDFVLQPE